MSSFDKLVIVAVILQAAYSLFQKLTRHRDQREVKQALVEQLPPPADFARWLASIRERVAALAQEAEALAKGLVRTLEGLRTDRERPSEGPSAPPTARALAEGARRILLEPLERTRDQLLPLHAQLATADPDTGPRLLEAAGGLNRIADQLHRLKQATRLVEVELRQRRRPGRAEILADAEAVANALVSPLAAFSQTRGRPTRLRLPVAAVVTAHPLWDEILPNHLVVVVPDDLGEDPLRWAEVARSVALVIEQDRAFTREIKQLQGPSGAPRLPVFHNRQFHFDPLAVSQQWLGTHLADALVVLMLGPAGLRGLMHMLQDPGGASIDVIGVAADGQHLSATPPTGLRMAAATWFLERMGHTREAETLRKHWEKLHGPLEMLVCPTLTGEAIGLTSAGFRVRAQQALEAFYTTTWASLGGYPLSAVPGLEMAPGVWGRVRQRTRDLAADVAFTDDPRVVLAAAIEAAIAHPGSEARIALGLRRAVLGGEEEAHRSAPRAQGPSDRVTRRDVRDAIVLGALLGSRRRE